MERSLVRRTRHRFSPDPRRVITKPFHPGEDTWEGNSRVKMILMRILKIPEAQVSSMLTDIMARFSFRHDGFEQTLLQSSQHVWHHIDDGIEVSHDRRLLIGAYFVHEYSIESASLCNPSIVAAPDQSGVEEGSLRVVMSLRAVGEGHISSIEFRTGIIGPDASVSFDPPGPFVDIGRRTPNAAYDKPLFNQKLAELGADNTIASFVLKHLPSPFTFEQLENAITLVEEEAISPAMKYETIKIMHWLASSNYTLDFPPTTSLSERVIFPAGPAESHGMEDARFVRFVDDDGSITYYATYTAFDGYQILPQLIMTDEFVTFQVRTLNGAEAQNKGLALFPRRIRGKYAMLSRQDAENLYYMTSDNIRFWNKAELLAMPSRPWQLIQIGNCGSPIETEAGWLVLTHGVGPMRQYAIGAMLLDLDNPHRLIARLPEPLLVSEEDDRDGYVPNVVYTCGGLIHRDHLIIPYGVADQTTVVATVAIGDLLDLLLENRCAT